MRVKLKDIYEYISYFEERYGDLNDYFCYMFRFQLSNKEMLELLYYYDDMKGRLDEYVDYEEYEARYEDRPFEWKLQKAEEIAHEICHAMRTPKYKPVKGLCNRIGSLKSLD